jgi:Fur family ferric uptake transcriptional regulator
MIGKKLLKSKRLRITDFRLAVLAIIQSSENAVSMEQIEADLGEFDRITL